MIKIKIKNKLTEQPHIDTSEKWASQIATFPKKDDGAEEVKLKLPSDFYDTIDFMFEIDGREKFNKLQHGETFYAPFKLEDGRAVYIEIKVNKEGSGDPLEISNIFKNIPSDYDKHLHLPKDWMLPQLKRYPPKKQEGDIEHFLPEALAINYLAAEDEPQARMEEKEICEECGEYHDKEVGVAQDVNTKKIKIYINESLDLDEDILYEKKDRCYKLAKRKYKVFPSAYASGFIVRCRKGKVAKKRKNENIEKLEEGKFDKEKSKGLHGWFSRQGGKGKSKGWVDCNTCRTNPKTGRKTCKSCGRQSGEKRGKYPACRPTPSACNKTGTRKKKSSKRVSWKSKKEE